MSETAATWECGRCGERFADHEAAQRHADTCDRPTMRAPAASDGLLGWPKQGETPNFVTELTCGHRGLLGGWTFPVIGAGQHCEVCDEPRTIVGVTDLGD